MRTVHLTFWCLSLLRLFSGKVFNQKNYEERGDKIIMTSLFPVRFVPFTRH